MVTRLRIYLDTSVISAYSDSRDPGRQELTRRFWQQLGSYESTISQLVLSELSATADPQRQSELLALVRPFAVVQWTDEMDSLVEAYMATGAFSPPLRADAQHVAAAVVSGIPILLSWNFRHLVNRTRRIRVNLVNSNQGYGQIEIIAPPELE